ncbi:uncharacterized protein LOC119728191 [Patiria miniata]|uniref:Uncharacterized protein n=1 Tax=Patiria miniata TaxID=46514 RepID=A0A913ZX70_PATMI|nr:uncharacterized protein LOC119728191 [Patiria miniata]
MADVLTPLQLCGFDPLPDGHNQVRENEPTEINPQSTILGLLQLQASMQQVILQQFQEINALKATISQVIGEQQRQRDYVYRLECALHHSKVVAEASPVPEIPTPPSTADAPKPQVPTEEQEPQSPEAQEVPQRCTEAVPANTPTSGQASHDGDEGLAGGQSLQEVQRRDLAIRRVVDLKLGNPQRMSRQKMACEPKMVQRLLHAWDRLEVKGGLLLYRTGGTQTKCLMVVPRGMREAYSLVFITAWKHWVTDKC